MFARWTDAFPIWKMFSLLGILLAILGACDKKDLGFKQSPVVYFPRLRPTYVQRHLSPAVSESSGIIQLKGNIWTLNDSGNTNDLFELDPVTGKLLRKVRVKNSANFDWEALTNDDTYVYIGDIGNNNGLRAKLRVYRLLKAQLEEPERRSILADTIEFYYPKHPKSPNPFLHNRDCEAMVSFGDSLYFFTKNRADEFTNLFSVPNQTGKWEALYKGNFDTYGIVTAASRDSSGSFLALLGYRTHPKWHARVPFVYLFWQYPKRDFFSGCSMRWDLRSRKQIEGITWRNSRPSEWLLSHEKAGAPSPGLYQLSLPLDTLTLTKGMAPRCALDSSILAIDTGKKLPEVSTRN